MSEIQLGTLTLGDEIAAGGQGSVTALKSDLATVLKRYHDASGPDFNAETLRWLVAERSRIFLAGSPVEEWSAWPKAVVRHGGRVVGFLMPRVPEAFTIEIGGRSRLADLSYLAAEPSPLWADVPLPTDEERVRVLYHLAAAMQALHHRDIVMGDVSFANIIWARTPRPRVMLIDCDGMRPPSRQPV